VPVDKGQAVDELLRRHGVRIALFAGDDATDLDGFDALDRADLEARLKVGVASDEGPPAIVERADLVVDGPGGMLLVLESLAAEAS
jgi:trehalose 6-phosphate phosphatase